MLKLSDLAIRPDLQLGPIRVSPSRRLVEGPGGQVHLEPLIMQVFLLLLDARGKVVTRNQLFDECWGGVIVGDDSLNQAIAKVRRAGVQVAPGLFEIETIPRSGYRLTGEILLLIESNPEGPSQGSEGQPGTLSRRVLVGGSVAALAALSGGYLWYSTNQRSREAALLVDHGKRNLQEAWPDTEVDTVQLFRKAVAIEPANAEAWGLLAVALRDEAEAAPPERTTGVVRDCEAAAARALSLNSREGNALAALATLRPFFGDWGPAEDRLRRVLEVAPDNSTALTHLILLLQSVGRAKESWDLNERAAALEPLSPGPQFRRALKYWIFGRVDEADLTIDRALQIWPRHPGVWNARLYIFAFTGRPDAALAMIDDRNARPKTFAPASEARWRVSLQALKTRSVADIEAAAEANRKVAAGGLAVAAIMILSALGKLDAAFEVADGFLLRKGPLVAPLWPDKAQMPINDQRWRRTMNLFTPATAALRADRRFKALCDGIGMTDYWRGRGIGPDPIFKLV